MRLFTILAAFVMVFVSVQTASAQSSEQLRWERNESSRQLDAERWYGSCDRYDRDDRDDRDYQPIRSRTIISRSEPVRFDLRVQVGNVGFYVETRQPRYERYEQWYNRSYVRSYEQTYERSYEYLSDRRCR